VNYAGRSETTAFLGLKSISFGPAFFADFYLNKMKALSLDLIMTGASTHVDGSLGLKFSTAELQPSEKTTVFELLNQNLKVLIQPSGEAPESLVEVKTPLNFKSPSSRFRSILYIEWKQKQPDMTFDEFYLREMEKLCERRKSMLQPE
jgi:hypothetical protein